MISGGDGILTFSIRKMRGMKAIQEVNGTPRWITEYIAEETGILKGPLFHIFVIWTTLYICMSAKIKIGTTKSSNWHSMD